MGLLRPEDIDDSYFSWTRRDNTRKIGFCETMFRVVGISSVLDSPDVSQEALDYVVYHECLHLRQRYRPSGRYHDARFRQWEHLYPGWRGIEDELRGLGDLGRRGCSFIGVLHRPSMEKRGFIFHGTDGEAELSIEQVEELAAKDDPEGVYALAMACLFGWDTEMDEVRGYQLLEHAVDLGNTDAMALMVRLYMQDEYDGIDNDRAAELAITAAKDGVPDAQLYAGLAYMDGVSVPQDYREAARYLSLAANQGEQEARNALAYLYENGLGVPKDEAKALKLYRTAARGGSVNAMFQTGVCYEFGTGTPVDLEKAREWYRKGAEAGDAFAAERLGHLTFEKDPQQGFEWFLKAAMDGVSTAMGTVGFCYLNGAGTERNPDEARKWLRMAADNGVEEAEEALKELPPEGSERLPLGEPGALLRHHQAQDGHAHPHDTDPRYPLRQDGHRQEGG